MSLFFGSQDIIHKEFFPSGFEEAKRDHSEQMWKEEHWLHYPQQQRYTCQHTFFFYTL